MSVSSASMVCGSCPISTTPVSACAIASCTAPSLRVLPPVSACSVNFPSSNETFASCGAVRSTRFASASGFAVSRLAASNVTFCALPRPPRLHEIRSRRPSASNSSCGRRSSCVRPTVMYGRADSAETELLQRVASELRAVFRQPHARIGKPRFPRRNGALQHCMLLLRPRIQPQHDCRARTREHNQHCQHNQQNPSRSSHVPFSIQAELPPSLCEILYQLSRQLQPKAPIYPALLQLQRPRRGGRLCRPANCTFKTRKSLANLILPLGGQGRPLRVNRRKCRIA